MGSHDSFPLPPMSRDAVPRDHPAKVTSGQDQTVIQTSEQRPVQGAGSIPISYAVLNQELQNRLFHKSITLDSARNPAMSERINASDANGRV